MSAPKIITLPQIKAALKNIDVFTDIENGFAAYARGEAVIPPVGEMLFEDPPGELHIKYGYLKSGAYYVVKIASGFPQNFKQGLSTGQGMMLLFDQKTGVVKGVLLDEGYLTEIRTAVAGALAAKYMAPKKIACIGIVGTGLQGKFQLEHLATVTTCRKVIVYGRTPANRAAYPAYFVDTDWEIELTDDVAYLAKNSQLIVTTTPATAPLLQADWINPGTHITAMGSDTIHKIELDPAILGKADIVVVDSLSQSESRGEIYQSVKAGTLNRADVIELGQIINDPELGRQNDTQITVTDLTGVAIQDLMIAKAVFEGVE